MDMTIYFQDQGIPATVEEAAVKAAMDYLDQHGTDSVLSAMRGAIAAGVAVIAKLQTDKVH